MMCFGRRGRRFGLLAMVAALVLVAALTTWWVLVALIPLAMMVSCMTTMVAMARTRSGPGMAGRRGCCPSERP